MRGGVCRDYVDEKTVYYSLCFLQPLCKVAGPLIHSALALSLVTISS